MIRIRPSSERGHFDHGWLSTYHTFSFSDYYDPKFMGFRSLRVINQDRLAAGGGFGTHSHRDMEIISYVLSGALSHRDSLGNGSVILPGEIQYMSAGSGVTHSEYNHSKDEPTHFLQIWILPDKNGYPPAYAQNPIPLEKKKNQLVLVASGTGDSGSIQIRQDVKLYASRLDAKALIEFNPAQDRHVWIQITQGAVDLNGETLQTGDGAAISDEPALKLTAKENHTEILLFDLT